MTTTYYTFNTRKVKVSGGADMLTLVPVVQAEPSTVSADGKVLAPKAFGGKLPSTVPQGEDKSETKAQILDFALCRKHMETRDAWQSLTQAAQDDEEFQDTRWEPVEQEKPEGREPSLREKTLGYLELCATAAVIITALSAAIAFLSLV